MIGELQRLEPSNFNEVLGNKKAVNEIKSLKGTGSSLLLLGASGTGKSCIGRLYLENYKEVSGTVLTAAGIRELSGNVLVNEFESLDKKKQKMFIDAIESKRIVLVATTVAGKSAIIDEIRTRCKTYYITYPGKEELCAYINMVLEAAKKEVSNEASVLIYQSFNNLRSLNTLLFLLMRESSVEITPEVVQKYMEEVDTPMNNLEEVKSALQKSIRGSDVDAACMYADNLMNNGYMEEMCRRLRVIASEDIGLANPNCVVVVNACIENALKLGLPEAKFSVLQAVAFMALQPKSNAIHTIINRCKYLPQFLKVPKNINTVHSKSYKNPHDYPNHWAEQQYAPIGYENYRVYIPCLNKIEQGYKHYWDKIKGE